MSTVAPWDPPWPPMRISASEWIVIRDSPRLPAAVIRRLEFENRSIWRVVTWAPTSEGRQLVGYFPTLEEADRSVRFTPPDRNDLRQYSSARTGKEWQVLRMRLASVEHPSSIAMAPDPRGS